MRSRKMWQVGFACVVMISLFAGSIGFTSLGHESEKKAPTKQEAAAQPLVGTWTYRSLRSDPDVKKSFEDLKFAAGTLIIEDAGFGKFRGRLVFGDTEQLALVGSISYGNPFTIRFQGKGDKGDSLDWVYDYTGYVIADWPNGVNQRPAIVGTIVRTEDHKSGSEPHGAKKGVVAQWIAVKQDDPKVMSSKTPTPGIHKKRVAKPFVFGNDPPRKRKHFLDLSEEEVKLLCDAVGCMRDGTRGARLSIHDPAQWDNFVAVHADHCSEVGEDKNQVHWSWQFLPWHRAYLYFIERHLAHQIRTVLKKEKEADQFALPYWDWTTEHRIPNTKTRLSRTIASPLFGFDLATDFDPAQVGDSNPFNVALWNGYRGPTRERPDMTAQNEDLKGWKIYTEEIRTYHTNPLHIDNMLRIPNFCVFGGWPVVSRQAGQGLLESSPHNTIHDWVGGRYGNNRDMGTLRYAALDPIFCLHHANVDRIWSLYNYTPKPGAPLPVPNECGFTAKMLEDWFDTRWEFVDTNGDLVYVTVADTIVNMKQITYQHDQQTELRIARLNKEKVLQTQTIPLSDKPVRLTNKPVTIPVSVDKMLATKKTDIREGKQAVTLLEIQVGKYHYTGRFQVKAYAVRGAGDVKVPIDKDHFIGSFVALDSHSGKNTSSSDDKNMFYVDVSENVSQFSKLAPAGSPFAIAFVVVGISSDQEPLVIEATKINIKVYK